jgi:hypothetical protein
VTGDGGDDLIIALISTAEWCYLNHIVTSPIPETINDKVQMLHDGESELQVLHYVVYQHCI